MTDTAPSTSETARRAAQSLELLHAFIYFAPEAEERFAALGLDRGRMAYYAGRAAPMGAVSAGVVAATFYNFNPESVARSIPRAWSIAAPQDIVEARLQAADEALRRMLGDETATSAEVAATAELAAEAAAACDPAGKPLHAGHADLPWPQEPHLKLWHAATLLREFRGDAHIAALQDAELSGLQALVLHSASGQGFKQSAARSLREWSQQQWAAAEGELRERDLLDAEGEITAAGTKLREDVESRTDAMSAAPWQVLGDRVEQLIDSGRGLVRALAKAGAAPRDLFGRD
ncbi:hypothetical protein IQ251_03365 [Saccharopolyspora sp. HNM0983]|uniref:SalK n=1 Tax=Saccharopolyspora montiporae TaxID=2781240 RepID=A0A929B8Q3_9PSEU|nr:hypothetical protein [Saccharopolyspora sp. HNM0983]MBE9373481.1 hypothetical protein [Saccharopolyspora sp. HNM0983]